MAGFSIPVDFPLHGLNGQELSNLSIGQHYLLLNFIRLDSVLANEPKYGAGARIEIESGFEFCTALGRTVLADNSDLANPAASLIPLLGCSITSVERLPNNELLLEFGEDGTLKLIVDDQGYESYHLHVAGQSIDVTKE